LALAIVYTRNIEVKKAGQQFAKLDYGYSIILKLVNYMGKMVPKKQIEYDGEKKRRINP